MQFSNLERAIISGKIRGLLAETAPLIFHIPNLPPLTQNPGCSPGSSIIIQLLKSISFVLSTLGFLRAGFLGHGVLPSGGCLQEVS